MIIAYAHMRNTKVRQFLLFLILLYNFTTLRRGEGKVSQHFCPRLSEKIKKRRNVNFSENLKTYNKNHIILFSGASAYGEMHFKTLG